MLFDNIIMPNTEILEEERQLMEEEDKLIARANNLECDCDDKEDGCTKHDIPKSLLELRELRHKRLGLT